MSSPPVARFIALLSCVTLTQAALVEIGNDPNGVSGSVDSWSSIMVIDETATYTNVSAGNQLITPVGFDIQVGANRGRVTPFLVKVNGDNDFTVVAIGQTRISGVDYTSTGVFEFTFSDTPTAISLAPGETLAPGITNANPDGSDNDGSVIPYQTGNENWLSGGSSAAAAGNLTIGSPPTPGSVTLDLSRTYAYSIDTEIIPAAIEPPADITYTGAQPVDGLPSGIVLGSFSTVDADLSDTHTYTFVTNPLNKYSISGNQLLTNAPASSQTIRIRTTDSAGLSFEKDFTFTIESQLPPTDIDPGATEVNRLATTGAIVGLLTGVDPNPSDQFIFDLVSGTGSDDNALFTISGNELLLASSIPIGKTTLSLRLRATDLGGASIQKIVTLSVVEPQLIISEFLASNNGGLLDEDGESSDWIEIYNPTGSCINLAGWFLTDTEDDLSRWEIPNIDIMPGGYLLIFASSKDRRDPTSELHTNFRLSASGEYLAIVAPGGSNIVDFYPESIPQFSGISYSQDGYLDPTPGEANTAAFADAIQEVSFSQPRGSYPSSFSLTLSAPGAAQIRYTTDGSKPSDSNGNIYSGPFNVTPSTAPSSLGMRTIRAIAIGGTALRQPVATHTYLFISDVINQSVFTSSITSDPTYGPLMDDAILAHPIISITKSGGLPGSTETETSIEMFDPSGREPSFQIDCGIKKVGGHSTGSPKNNFRLFFRSDYGSSKLDYPLFANHPYSLFQSTSFDRLNLRSGSHDNFFWLSNPANPPNSGGPAKGDAQYLRNRWISDMQLRMGQPAMHGRWVQVFINGSYHGQYHLLEHPNQDFQAAYQGGDKSEYEFTNSANASKTGSDNWQAVWANVKTAASNGGTAARDWIDFENLADFMVLGFYSGNPWDWRTNQNWLTGGPNQAGQGGWKFYAWDSDVIFQDPGANVLNQNVPDGIFSSLITDPEFAIVFRDRVYQHFFHDGLLTPTQAQLSFDSRAAEIETSIVAETARWQGAAANAPWDRDDEWDTELNRMRTTYFPTRHLTTLQQFRNAGWYPVEAPEYAVRGGNVTSGYQPFLSTASGTIYYTTNGSDPRTSGQIFTAGSLTITQATQIRARSLAGSEWSPVNIANFTITGTVPAGPGQLDITEVHYNPFGSDDTEFLEIQNTTALPLDLSGVTLSSALSYTFPGNTILQPGQHILVVEDTTAFATLYQNNASPYYQPNITVSGSWSGRLSNSGETIIISAADTTQILTLTYNDSGRTDGEGSSLEFISGVDRPSSEYHGSPGFTGSGPDNRIVINEILADSPSKIELLNTTTSPINITNWLLTDNLAIPAKYIFTSGTIINHQTFSNALSLDRTLGGELTLLEADISGNPLRFVDKVSFSPSAFGESTGRYPDGQGRLHPLLSQTFGQENSLVRSGPVIIREVHYNPIGSSDDLEFIEIWNSGNTTRSLDSWALRGEVDYDFPLGQTLAPGQALIITGITPVSFTIPTSSTILGPWQAGQKLNNAGGEIRLQRAGGIIEDSVLYNDGSPWPIIADGSGPSLRRLSPSVYGDDPANWYAEPSPLSGMTFTDWSTTTGNSDLMTFALGTTPSLSLTEANQLTYSVRPGTQDLSIIAEVSNNLKDWDVLAAPISSNPDQITVQINPILDNPVFIRLRISEAP